MITVQRTNSGNLTLVQYYYLVYYLFTKFATFPYTAL